MSWREFRGDDDGYLSWLKAHPEGYVVNIYKSYNPTEARLHAASCSALRNRRGPLTEPYVKVCAGQQADLKSWALRVVGQEIEACRRCNAGPGLASTSVVNSAPGGGKAVARGRYLVSSPKPGSSVIAAWADDYIHFENEPEWQKILRRQITTQCAQLDPPPDEVVHAMFYGNKPSRMDIENLVLYNLHYSFIRPGRNGIRFDHGLDLPPAPDGETYRVGYRYALAPRAAHFADWVQGRTVASFDWTDLGEFRREKVLAQVWLALARRRDGQPQPALMAGTPFAVKVEIRPPHVNSPGPNTELVKGIIDGVVSAFQAHTDTSTSGEISARLAKFLPAGQAEIETLLLDRRSAVLGAVPRLVFLRGDAVQWNPADDWCVAGELLNSPPEPASIGWAIKGQVVELSRRTGGPAPKQSTADGFQS